MVTITLKIKAERNCGFNVLISFWNRCVEAIKESVHSHLADDLEINKAVLYLRQRDVESATDALKSFEKRTTKMATNAAVNLSTIFYLVRRFPSLRYKCFNRHVISKGITSKLLSTRILRAIRILITLQPSFAGAIVWCSAMNSPKAGTLSWLLSITTLRVWKPCSTWA